LRKCRRGHEKLDGEKTCKVCQARYNKLQRAGCKRAFKPFVEALKRVRTEAASRSKKIERKEKPDMGPVRKLKANLRIRTSKALRGRYKSGSAVKDLGCTGDELRLYLEAQFIEGMTWDNYGIKVGHWSIDHIIPLSSVDLTNRDEFLKVSHYTNLQPMWHVDNLKKSNKFKE
jgi:hypothetical protein